MKQTMRLLLPPVFLLLAAALATGASFSNAATPSAADELRAINATPQDIAEGKRVATASCANCHGIDGISKTKEVPHIAGQRPGYHYLELRAYQSGGRGNTPMNNIVRFLSDDALAKVSAYYASLDPAAPAPAASTKGAATKADPVSAGKAAAAGCSGCHGETGISSVAGMPNLAALDPKYLVQATSAYKKNLRKHDMMKTLVSALTEAETNNIALFFALQKPGKSQTPSSGDEVAGKTAAGACFGCHGEGGVSSGTAPSLAGQDAQYFASAMRAYKDGSRSDPAMKAPAASVDETAVKNMAAYFAKQQPQSPKVRKPLTTVELAERCNRCHGVNGNSTDPRSPALAAQRADYLDKVLLAYQKGERKSTSMTAMLDGLSIADLQGLAAHYARQKARAIVFMQPQSK